MIRNAMIWHFVLNSGDLFTLKHCIFRLFPYSVLKTLEYLFNCEDNIVFLNGDVFKTANWNNDLGVPSFGSAA